MKLLFKNIDTAYLYSLKDFLEANGIPASVQGENTASMVTPYLLTQPGLWVYLDEQYQDAVNLLDDENYEVQNKVDVEEFYRINEDLISDTSVMNRHYIKLGLTVAGWMIAAFVVFQVLQYLTA